MPLLVTKAWQMLDAGLGSIALRDQGSCLGSLAYARWASAFLAISIAIATIALPLRASAQVAGSVGASAAANEAQPAAPAAEKPTALDHWWFGGYYRYNWVPAYLTSAFFSRAPGI